MTSDGNPPNRLIHEKSPYLLQHAGNPVDWYPWGEEAFHRAEIEDRPIFLSIGYSTCHWCHVMERESFEDPSVADRMNEVFVSIKVDREERPDIDSVYMKASQLATGSGGWPLSVIITPDGKPFFLGTYIPRDARFGMMGFVELIDRVELLWKNDRKGLIEASESINSALSSRSEIDTVEFSDSMIQNGYEHMVKQFDSEHGGFGSSPKFPSPHQLLFLLRYWYDRRDPAALDMVTITLTSMRRGGIYDQIGGGFHRYSTDRKWLLPHFEKMLYDQAMHVQAYLEGYMITKNELYRSTAEETLEYVIRDLGFPEGGFYSSEDADSEGEEGKFYIWDLKEVEEILGSNIGSSFAIDFGIIEHGNFSDESSGRESGKNILHITGNGGDRSWSDEIRTLFEYREMRKRPDRDDKVLADWNGLMISAMSRAGQVLENKRYIDRSKRAADFILDNMITDEGRLLHRYRDGEAAIPGFLDDHAFMINGLLDLYESHFENRYLKEAVRLTEIMIAGFWDASTGGFFQTSHDSERLISREKDAYDGAYPSGNSAAMIALVRISRLTGRTDLSDMASRIGMAFASSLDRAPWAHTYLLCGYYHARGPSSEIMIVGPEHDIGTRELIGTARMTYLPSRVITLVRPDDTGIRDMIPLTSDMVMIEEKPTAYVCRGGNCDIPTNDPSVLWDQLRETTN